MFIFALRRFTKWTGGYPAHSRLGSSSEKENNCPRWVSNPDYPAVHTVASRLQTAIAECRLDSSDAKKVTIFQFP
jgi:hypothetical protein